jgi:hypothetical protein
MVPTTHVAVSARCVITAGPLRGITGCVVEEYPGDRVLVQFDEPKGVSVLIAAEMVSMIEPEDDAGRLF